jgi:pimeloyl-ACP methyl ester carboxylesterase
MQSQRARLLGTVWGRLALGIVLVIALLITTAAGYDRYAESRLQTAYPAPGQFVQLAAGRMHYRCLGSGEPTLVFAAGIGGGALDWSQVMPALAQGHRVCAFDRLGQDWSDAAPQPRVFSTAADELHAALDSLGIVEPVLVGHSLGGALAQLYAARYPVAGVILVDGLTADVAEPVVARLGGYRSLDGLARLGILRPIGGLFAHPAYPQELRGQMVALRSGSAALLRLTEEGALAAQDVPAELRAAEARLTMPLLVIAAGECDVPGLPDGAFQAAAAAFSQRHPQAEFVVIAGAPHYVQATHPAEVTATIERWLGGSRSAVGP